MAATEKQWRLLFEQETFPKTININTQINNLTSAQTHAGRIFSCMLHNNTSAALPSINIWLLLVSDAHYSSAYKIPNKLKQILHHQIITWDACYNANIMNSNHCRDIGWLCLSSPVRMKFGQSWVFQYNKHTLSCVWIYCCIVNVFHLQL